MGIRCEQGFKTNLILNDSQFTEHQLLDDLAEQDEATIRHVDHGLQYKNIEEHIMIR